MKFIVCDDWSDRMNSEQYKALFKLICTDLVRLIMVKRNIAEDEAANMLYSSKLYTILEQEETKVWYYSTDMPYSLFEHEQKNGQLIFPDV